jgi:repressor LexA
MNEPLTTMERQVYHYLIDFLAQNTFQPSIREIARRFHIKSTKTVSDVLIGLANKGYIERQEARSRGVRLVGYATTTRTMPVPRYDRVNDGEPALLPEHRAAWVTMDRRFLPSDDVVLLTVRGDTMSDRGILDGDLVLVSPSAQPRDGDLVALRSGSVAALEVFGRRDSMTILGVVCGIFRPFFEQEPESGVGLPDDDAE